MRYFFYSGNCNRTFINKGQLKKKKRTEKGRGYGFCKDKQGRHEERLTGRLSCKEVSDGFYLLRQEGRVVL